MAAHSRTIDLLLRLEWAAVLAAAIAAYILLDGSWLLFVLLILAPDLAMLGYLAGRPQAPSFTMPFTCSPAP